MKINFQLKNEENVKGWRVITSGDDYNAIAILAAVLREDADFVECKKYGIAGSYLRIDYNDRRVFRSAPIKCFTCFSNNFMFELEDGTEVQVSIYDIAPELGYPFLMEYISGNVWNNFYAHIEGRSKK